MIRKTFRFGIRFGLLVGIGLALFKLVQGRRSSDLGRPSADWAPAPAPTTNPNLPKQPPEPELITPAMLQEVISKKASQRVAPPDVTPAPPPESAARVEPAQKKAPAKKAAAKKAAEPAAAGPVKKITPKKAPAKKAAAPSDEAPVAKKASAKKADPAKKAAPAKKAPKTSE
jgi:hypothetical protein